MFHVSPKLPEGELEIYDEYKEILAYWNEDKGETQFFQVSQTIYRRRGQKYSESPQTVTLSKGEGVYSQIIE